jgi:hypothetical protein
MTIHNEISPDEQRTRTKLANLTRENLHRNCSIKIKEVLPHWGLYCDNPRCKKTGSWIGWIKKDQLKNILKKTNK